MQAVCPACPVQCCAVSRRNAFKAPSHLHEVDEGLRADGGDARAHVVHRHDLCMSGTSPSASRPGCGVRLWISFHRKGCRGTSTGCRSQEDSVTECCELQVGAAGAVQQDQSCADGVSIQRGKFFSRAKGPHCHHTGRQAGRWAGVTKVAVRSVGGEGARCRRSCRGSAAHTRCGRP